jgi:hypothetical protein
VRLERRTKKWLKNWLQNEVNCTKEVRSEDLNLFPSKQQGSFVTVVRLGNWLTSIKALGLSGRKYMMKAMESWQRESHPTNFFTISDHLLKQST